MVFWAILGRRQLKTLQKPFSPFIRLVNSTKAGKREETKMALGERGVWDKSESRYCGVETEFDEDVPGLLSSNLNSGAFDFVVAPLVRSAVTSSFFFLLMILWWPISQSHILSVNGQ